MKAGGKRRLYIPGSVSIVLHFSLFFPRLVQIFCGIGGLSTHHSYFVNNEAWPKSSLPIPVF